MKYLILVGDGMGDLPLPELKYRTPLEAARTPTLDSLCQREKFSSPAQCLSAIPPALM